MIEESLPRLTRKQKRLAEKANTRSPLFYQHFNIKRILPKTENQCLTFDSYYNGDNIFLHGCAGTGKTFISMFLALNEIINDTDSEYKKLIIIRTAQASKDIGFLPGSEKQKLEVYEAPYKQICSELFGRDDAYDILKTRGIIEFQSTSFLRGTTKSDCIMIIDEVQNQNYQELRTVLTRVGDRCKVMLCGDTKQDDLTSERYKETSGLRDMIKVFSKMESMNTIQFNINDIVRSGFVKDFLIAETKIFDRILN